MPSGGHRAVNGLSGQRAPSRAAGAVAALRIGAAVRDGAVADGTADGLFATACLDRGFAGVKLGVQVGLRSRNELLEQGCAGGSSLLGAIVAERVGLALRFENEGSEPGRKVVRQIENRPQVGHAYMPCCFPMRFRVSVVIGQYC